MILTQEASSRPFLSSRDSLIVMEDHDEAYAAWKRLGVTGAALLHIDAHIDFKWITPCAETLLAENSMEAMLSQIRRQPLWNLTGQSADERVHIGNYIHQAITDGIVNQFVWIFPDEVNMGAQTGAVERILGALSAMAPHLFLVSKPDSAGCFRGKICGIPFYAAPLSCLEHVLPSRDVLLNIDLDFFIIRSFHDKYYPFSNLEQPSFWLKPQPFIQKLSDAGVAPRLTTFAYSVEEGYTPAVLRFLGDELAVRLVRPLTDLEEARFSLLHRIFSKNGFESREHLITSLEQAVRQDPAAPIWFNLAMQYAADQKWDGAREAYQKAVEKDSAYRTVYNHAGPILWDRGFYAAATASYALMRRLDPCQPDHELFELKKQVKDQSWNAGAEHARSLMGRGQDSFHLRCYFGECLWRLGQYEEASRLLTFEDAKYAEDLLYPQYLWLKVRTALKLAKWNEALNDYHRLNHFMIQSPEIHWGIALLYLRGGNFYKARRHVIKAGRLCLLKMTVRLKEIFKVKRTLGGRELVS